jgi:hypothetical protein
MNDFEIHWDGLSDVRGVKLYDRDEYYDFSF